MGYNDGTGSSALDKLIADSQIEDKEAQRTGGLTPEENALGPDFDWRTAFRTDAARIVRSWSPLLGISEDALDSFVRNSVDKAIARINRDVMVPPDPGNGYYMSRSIGEMTEVPPDIYQRAWESGIRYYMDYFRLDEEQLQAAPSGGGGGGSGGTRKPTADEIRSMFDEDQLTQAATNLWRAWLVDEPEDARGIAKSYIDAVVASGAEQEMDYQTFVENHIKKSSRYDLIYQNKPEGLNETQYLAPYVNAAQAVMGGGDISGVAAEGASLGASASAYEQRLKRTREHTSSLGFMQNLESTVREANQVLRG